MEKSNKKGLSLWQVSLVSGGAAGICVDVSLYPVDTIKTRLQAPEGFFKAGGFKGVYNGVAVAALGSAPSAALFFTAYDTSKHALEERLGRRPEVHMLAASIGEAFACIVRVPTENVKQKQQIGVYKSLKEGFRGIMQTQGVRGFFVGYGTTVAREIPFSFIQFPIWEKMKDAWAVRNGDEPLQAWQGALCGSASGALAGAITTPLDVCKTRLMTSRSNKYSGMFPTMRTIYQEEGWRALFSGLQGLMDFNWRICILRSIRAIENIFDCQR
eukprot:m.152944 g.152944  ORF g.152944 m.152944 type:complete len:271 (-) comp15060_c0_seq3:1855-2667(-)